MNTLDMLPYTGVYNQRRVVRLTSNKTSKRQKMSRYDGIAGISAAGSKAGFFPREDAEYTVMHRRSFTRDGRGGYYWLSEFRILESTSETAPAGGVRAQMFAFKNGKEFAQSLAKALVMALEDVDEKDVTPAMMDKWLPEDGEKVTTDIEDVTLLKLRTNPGESRSGQPITHHNWEAAPPEDYARLQDEYVKYLAEDAEAAAAE